jgi:hypothetical protein
MSSHYGHPLHALNVTYRQQNHYAPTKQNNFDALVMHKESNAKK